MKFFKQYGIRLLMGLTALLGCMLLASFVTGVRPIPLIFNPIIVIFHLSLATLATVLFRRAELASLEGLSPRDRGLARYTTWFFLSGFLMIPIVFSGLFVYAISGLQGPVKDKDGKTYYVMQGFPDDDTCSDYQVISPGIIKDINSQMVCQGKYSLDDQQVIDNEQSSDDSSASNTSQTPLPNDSNTESTTLPPAAPPATVAQDGNAYLLPTSFTDSTGQEVQVAISYQNTGYYVVIQKNDVWQPTESLITGVGTRANPDPYAFATADERVWFFDAGGTSAEHLFFTSDGGTSWSEFSSAGFEDSEDFPSFLQSVSLENGEYTLELNYPTWAGITSDSVIYTSTDGLNWEKE